MKHELHLYKFCTSNGKTLDWIASIREQSHSFIQNYIPECIGINFYHGTIENDCIYNLKKIICAELGENINTDHVFQAADFIFRDIAEHLTSEIARQLPAYCTVFRVNPMKEIGWYLGPASEASLFSTTFMSGGYAAVMNLGNHSDIPQQARELSDTSIGQRKLSEGTRLLCRMKVITKFLGPIDTKIRNAAKNADGTFTIDIHSYTDYCIRLMENNGLSMRTDTDEIVNFILETFNEILVLNQRFVKFSWRDLNTVTFSVS